MALSLADSVSALSRDGDAWRIATPGDWAQGRTLYGGMTAALAHEAVRRSFGDLGPIRSAQLAFIGPAQGALVFRPAVLRRGRSTAVAAVDCEAEDGVAARATFFFGADRDSAILHDHGPRRPVPLPDDCPPFHRTTKPLPGFLGRYEFRLAAGTPLFTPGGVPEFAVWVRLRDGTAGLDPVTLLLAVGDALPCAAMANFPKPAPVSTMSWQLDFHQPLPGACDWYLVTSASDTARDGYSLQAMRTFDMRGQPLTTARQTVAIFA